MKINKENIEIKKPPLLFKKTQKIIHTIQSKTDGDFLSYWIKVMEAQEKEH